MNAKERTLAADFLNEYADRLSNDGCNDWNFPKGWTEAEARDFAVRVWTESMDESNRLEMIAGMGESGFPVLMNWEVAQYLSELIDDGVDQS